MIVAISLGGERWASCKAAYPGVIMYAGTRATYSDVNTAQESEREAIADTYRRLAIDADVNEWDGVLVIQDDVRFYDGVIPEGYGVFGRLRGKSHWCPQAFRFDRPTWLRAREVWNGQLQVCMAWTPLIRTLPRLDLASDSSDGPQLPPFPLTGRNAPCVGCPDKLTPTPLTAPNPN